MSDLSSIPLPTFADVLAARRVISRYLRPTPLHNYPLLDELVGTQVWVKHENYQPIGAFKVRGGIAFMAQLPDAQRALGVATASTGNHGQSVAYAARLFGVKAVIVAPEGANPVKVAAMRGYGADVRLLGADFEAAKKHCAEIAQAEGLYFVSSGDEPSLIAGVATHTLEILEEQPDIDVVIVPVGGGSGGAIYNDGNTMTLSLCGVDIRNNEVNAHGSAIFFVSNDHSGNIVIDRSVISDNEGGSWYPTYPQISGHDDTPIDVTDSTIE